MGRGVRYGRGEAMRLLELSFENLGPFASAELAFITEPQAPQLESPPSP